MKQNNHDLDVILINGDFVAHGLAANPGNTKDNWQQQKDIIR